MEQPAMRQMLIGVSTSVLFIVLYNYVQPYNAMSSSWLQLHCQGHPSSEARSAGSRLCVGELLAHGLVSRIGKDTRGVDGEGAGGVEATLASWQRSKHAPLGERGAQSSLRPACAPSLTKQPLVPHNAQG